MTTLAPSFVTLMNGSVISSATALHEPTPFRLSPSRTVLGLPISTLSYVFLAIGGIAPIVFIVLVIVGMKCYSWRKVKRYKRYATRLQISQDVWDVERRQYLQRHRGSCEDDGDGGTSFGSRNVLYNHDGSIEEDYFQATVGSAAHKAALSYSRQSPRLHGARISNSNPNVYFLETPVLQLHRNKPKMVDKTPSRRMLMKKNKNKSKRGYNSKERLELSQGDFHVEVTFDGNHIESDLLCESLPGIDLLDVPDPPPPPPPPPDAASGCVLPHSMVSITSDEAEALHCFDNIYLEPLNANAGAAAATGKDGASALPRQESVNMSTGACDAGPGDTGSYATSTDYEDHVQAVSVKWIQAKEQGHKDDNGLETALNEQSGKDLERRSQEPLPTCMDSCQSPELSDRLSPDIYDTLATSTENCHSPSLSTDKSKQYVVNGHVSGQSEDKNELWTRDRSSPLNGYLHHSQTAVDKVNGITSMEMPQVSVVMETSTTTDKNIVPQVPQPNAGGRRYVKRKSSYGPGVGGGAGGEVMRLPSLPLPQTPSSLSSPRTVQRLHTSGESPPPSPLSERRQSGDPLIGRPESWLHMTFTNTAFSADAGN